MLNVYMCFGFLSQVTSHDMKRSSVRSYFTSGSKHQRVFCETSSENARTSRSLVDDHIFQTQLFFFKLYIYSFHTSTVSVCVSVLNVYIQ